VAADERFLIYSSNHPLKHEPKRLKIAFRKAGGWTSPLDLGDEVNEAGSNIDARLSPDQKTLFFSTNTVPPVSFPRSRPESVRELGEMQVSANGSENIWYVSLGQILENARANKTGEPSQSVK